METFRATLVFIVSSDLPIIYKFYNIYYAYLRNIQLRQSSLCIDQNGYHRLLRDGNSRVNLFPHVFSCHM